MFDRRERPFLCFSRFGYWNIKAEFFRLAGSTVVIEYKNKSIITAIRIIEFGEKTTKFILLNGDEVTIDNNQKLTRNSEGYIIIKAHNE